MELKCMERRMGLPKGILMYYAYKLPAFKLKLEAFEGFYLKFALDRGLLLL